LPDSLKMATTTGRVRGATRSINKAMETASKRVDTKAPAAPAMRPGSRPDFSL
jgi:hypothetical protein